MLGRTGERARMSSFAPGKSRPRIAYVVTVDLAVKFFEGQSAFLAANGFDVDAICSPGPRLEALRRQGITPWAVPIEREISPARDLLSFWRLWRLFRCIRPDIVVAGTPKGGLLGCLAARFAGVPHVQYLLHGLRLETTTGIKRWILMAAEWTACHAAQSVRCVSPSLLARTVALELAPAARCTVIGNGSTDGIAMERFATGAKAKFEAMQVRRELRIPFEAPVIGFVGRMTRDKGIWELYEAFMRLQGRYPDLRLLLVGDFETGDPVPSELRARIEANPAVILIGYVDNVEHFYPAMDVVALPTYREGLSTVLLEAQYAEVPVVTTNATGAVDAIVEGETGLRVPIGDAGALASALDRLLGDAALRFTLGAAGRSWVEKNFRREDLWRNLLAWYHSQLRSRQDRAIFRLYSRNSRIAMLKTVIDRSLAGFALCLLSPLLSVVACLIWLRLGNPVLLRQTRIGFKEKPFTILKFRTMTDDCDSQGVLLNDTLRITRLGRFLRAWSLDELPQLWNVLRGDMAFVGPRPLLHQHLPPCHTFRSRRHEVKPGMTGWAQVNGRNELDWEMKLGLDAWYVDHRSPWLDLRILGLTVLKVFRREGIGKNTCATVPEFTPERHVVGSHD
jgi:lipopolysaccharide/colanic/teichoic acid biosynthesis glycosyltransferase/glycosyltransferase involved in cell wall biosynthesis